MFTKTACPQLSHAKRSSKWSHGHSLHWLAIVPSLITRICRDPCLQVTFPLFLQVWEYTISKNSNSQMATSSSSSSFFSLYFFNIFWVMVVSTLRCYQVKKLFKILWDLGERQEINKKHACGRVFNCMNEFILHSFFIYLFVLHQYFINSKETS